MRKNIYHQSTKVKNFYKAIRIAAAEKFNVLPDYVGVVANSMNYTASVAIPTDIYMNSVIALVRYDINNSVVGVYAMLAEDLMKMFKKMVDAGQKIVTHEVNGCDQLTKVDWNYIEQYQLNM